MGEKYYLKFRFHLQFYNLLHVYCQSVLNLEPSSLKTQSIVTQDKVAFRRICEYDILINSQVL